MDRSGSLPNQPVPHRQRSLEDINNPTPIEEDVDLDITTVYSSDATLAAIAQLGTITTLNPTVVTDEFYNSWLWAYHC